MAQNYLRLVATLFDGAAAAALAVNPRALQVRVTSSSPQARRDLRGLFERMRLPPGRKIVLVNPNSGQRLPQRRWPAANFAALIEQLLAIRPDVMVMLIGSTEDRDCTAAIARAVGRARCIDIAGELPIASLPALFERSQLLIGNDSGPAHFAAVSDLPVVVLFGPETPVLFRPLGPGTVLTAQLSCSPCISPANQRRSTCRDNRCMQHIAVAEVLRASLDRLSLPHRPLPVADTALRA
jgi:ADP-heptose:LPS heptosyltransferase